MNNGINYSESVQWIIISNRIESFGVTTNRSIFSNLVDIIIETEKDNQPNQSVTSDRIHGIGPKSKPIVIGSVVS